MAQIINLNDAAPAAPANAKNGKWQKGATTGVDPSTGLPIFPASVYFSAATLSALGLVFPDGVGIGVDVTGKLSLLGNPVSYKGVWSGSALYNVGDVVQYSGQAYICISQIDETVAPGLVQAAASTGNTKAFASNVTAGNLLIVLLGSHSGIATPTDTLGTVYTLIDSSGGPGLFGNFGSLYYGVAPSSGANTVASSGTTDLPGIAIAEFRGVTSVLNTHAANGNVSSLSLTTTQPSMLIIGRTEKAGNADTYTGSGGVTVGAQHSSASGSDPSNAIGYLAEGAAGTYTPGLSGTTMANCVTIAGAFLSNGLSPDIDTAHWLALGTVEPSGAGNLFLGTPNGSPGQASLRSIAPADLPVATTSQVGGVKPDGTSIAVAAGVISCARQVSAKTANYTATSSDNGKMLVFNSGSAVTLTLPGTIPANGWFIYVQNIGAGALSVSPGSAQIDGSGSSLSVTTGQGLLIGTDGTNYYTERGMGSSGGMSNPMTTAGDIIVGGASGVPARLAKGTDGQFLKMVSGAEAWGSVVQSTGVTVDGAGSAPATGIKGFITIPFDCTITAWSIMADVPGSAVFGVKSASSVAGIGSTSSIVASAPPTLSSAQAATSSTLTGWTTAIAAGTLLEFDLSSVTTCTRLTLQLTLQRS